MINQAPLFRKIFVSLLFLVSGIPKSSTRTLHGNFVPSERTLYGNFLPEQTGKCRLTLLSLTLWGKMPDLPRQKCTNKRLMNYQLLP